MGEGEGRERAERKGGWVRRMRGRKLRGEREGEKCSEREGHGERRREGEGGNGRDIRVERE
jgi:hypothetical protein